MFSPVNLSLKILTFEGNSRQSRVENRSCSVNYNANVNKTENMVGGSRKLKKSRKLRPNP